MAREELVSSAVTFLQDPSVATSPLDKRVAFLQSKNLTQEEIDLALSRVGGESTSSGGATPQSTNASSPQPQQSVTYRPPPPPPNQGYNYAPYGQQWQQPPPELPKRDWRDWFIMATVMGGVGYGLYFVTKRYISPLISPPTPPQIQQDKESIDEQFSRAFTLLDQLSTDTANLKAAEESRSENLDATLREVESVISELKTASRRRDDETRRVSDEIKDLKDRIPKAMEGAREGNDKRLKELGTELRSLKVLVGNRVGGGGASPSTPSTAGGRTVGGTPVHGPTRSSEDTGSTASTANNSSGAQASAPTPAPTTTTTPQPSAPQASAPTSTPASSTTPQTNGAPATSQSSGSTINQFGKPAAIPAWQMAAANRSSSSGSTPQPATVENSTDAEDSNEKQEASAS